MIIIFTHTAIMDLLPPLSSPFMNCPLGLPSLVITVVCHHNLPQLPTSYHHHTLPLVTYDHYRPLTTTIDRQ